MTFAVGRNQVHIGWGTFVTVIIAVASGVWACKAEIDSFKETQAASLKQQAEILVILKAKDKKDSAQDYRIDTLSAHVVRSDYTQRDLKRDITGLQDRGTPRYVTETRDRNGHIRQHPYNNN
jgi:hypothetical protein